MISAVLLIAAINANAYPASAITHTQRQTLDPNGNRSTTTDAGNTTSTQSFDAFNRITSTTTPGEGATTNTWNADGTLATVSRSNGTATRYRYDRAQRIKTITHSHNAATTLEFAYAYDANGNREQEIRTQSAIAGQGGSVTTTTYGYDNDDRLIETEIRHQPISVTTPDEKTAWTLDGVGNRQSEIVTRLSDNTITSSKIYTYNARDQLTLMHDSINLLDVAYTYDNNGNRTARTVTHQSPPSVETTTYIFDARDRLTGVQPNAPNTQNAPTIEYTYDADTRRIERIETPVGAGPTATLYLYNGTTLVHEADPSADTSGFHLTDTYRHSATLDRHIAYAQSGGSDIRYYQLDALQTPVAMTDASGLTINRTAYSAWGEIEEQVANGQAQAPWMLPNYNPDVTGQAALLSNDGQSIGFTGYQKDGDTGLYYAQARWYAPLVGNFNGMDPAFGKSGSPITFNKYLYAAANPLFFLDGDGRAPVDSFRGGLEQGYAMASNDHDRQIMQRSLEHYDATMAGRRNAPATGVARSLIGIGKSLLTLAADTLYVIPEATLPDGADVGSRVRFIQALNGLAEFARSPIDTTRKHYVEGLDRSVEWLEAGNRFEARAAAWEANTDLFTTALGAEQAIRSGVRAGARGIGNSFNRYDIDKGGASPSGIGARDFDLDLESSSMGSRAAAQGPSTAPVVANVPEQAASGTVAVENKSGIEADTSSKPEPLPEGIGPYQLKLFPDAPYFRREHYGNTPTPEQRASVPDGMEFDHEPILVVHYFDGPGDGRLPGYNLTPQERRAMGASPSSGRAATPAEQRRQGAEAAKYSKEQKKKWGLDQ